MKEFETHVQYEYYMMILVQSLATNTRNSLIGVDQSKYNVAALNAFHESVCVHVYNLMTYLPTFGEEDIKIREKYKKMIEGQILSLTPEGRTLKDKLTVADDQMLVDHMEEMYKKHMFPK